MSLFNIDPENPFNGPYQGLPPEEHGSSLSHAKAAMEMVPYDGFLPEIYYWWKMLPVTDIKAKR